MTALASDTFTQANGALNANWTGGTGETAVRVTSNACAFANAGLGFDQCSFFSGTLVGGGTTWPNDQYSKATISEAGSNNGGDQGGGLVVRHAAAARTYYRFTVDHAATNNFALSKFTAGAYSNFGGTDTQAWVDGDTWEMDIVGTTITILLNGSIVTSKTDSGLAAGNPGINYSSTDNGTPTLDNWEGGNFTGSSIPPGLGPVVSMQELALTADVTSMMR